MDAMLEEAVALVIDLGPGIQVGPGRTLSSIGRRFGADPRIFPVDVSADADLALIESPLANQHFPT